MQHFRVLVMLRYSVCLFIYYCCCCCCCFCKHKQYSTEMKPGGNGKTNESLKKKKNCTVELYTFLTSVVDIIVNITKYFTNKISTKQNQMRLAQTPAESKASHHNGGKKKEKHIERYTLAEVRIATRQERSALGIARTPFYRVHSRKGGSRRQGFAPSPFATEPQKSPPAVESKRETDY